MRFPRIKSDQGETLVELIVAIAILGICIVAIGSGIGVSFAISALHARQSTASAFLHNYAESLQRGSYQACTGGTPNYVAGFAAPANFNPPSQVVTYWHTDSRSFTSSCPTPDAGAQQVNLTLTSVDGRTTESLLVTIRNGT